MGRPPRKSAPDTAAWREHQLLIGRHLSYEDWRPVWWAFESLSAAKRLIVDNETERDRLDYGRSLHTEAHKAALALRPVAGHPGTVDPVRRASRSTPAG